MTALLTLAAVIFCGMPAIAASPDKYASSSVLAEGKWVKIDISTPGLQTLSAQTLKNFGFSRPEKVNVYGYGGQMVSETLSPDQPDDLPMQPLCRQSNGAITFYAVGNQSWKAAIGTSAMEYTHTINPYSETSYYFLSDRETEPTELPAIDLTDIEGLGVKSAFTAHLVHERDLVQAGESGRNYLGEDFRLAKNQNFDFSLPDNTDGNTQVRICFATNTSGGSSSILVSANGERLASTGSDRIGEVSASSTYYNTTTTVKKVANTGDNLRIGIEYSQGGVVNIARLDWIEVEYERRLAMRDSRLEFHSNFSTPTALQISGATEETIVWDVTDPANPRIAKGVYDPTGKTLTLGIRETGYREFIAFEPTAKGATVPGRYAVANQNLHSLPTPDMLIISPEQYTKAAERIADIHRSSDGMLVHVITPEKIYNEFSSGNADLSAFRKILKMWHDRNTTDTTGHAIRYCLIMGRPTFDQKIKNQETMAARYPRPLIWESPTGLSESTSYCTDDFIGMLEDETRPRSLWERRIDVGVGRYPVTSVAEAEAAAEKLETYVREPLYGAWRNNVLVISDDDDNNAHLNQAQWSIERMSSATPGENYAFERLYLDSFELKMTGTGMEYPEATSRLLRKWEKEGVALINYIGHANPKEWGHEKLLTWTQMNAMTNQQLPVLYAATCSFGTIDAHDVSGAEVMLFNPAGGAVAVITPSRSVYISKNANITNAVSDRVLQLDTDGRGMAIGDIMRQAKNNCTDRSDNMLRYHTLGDPALRMPVPRLCVRIDSIAGLPLAANIEDAPILKARSTVDIRGHITDGQGNPVEFNGPVQFTLFDAEVSVETHGNGKNGVATVYQDRIAKLATGMTTVRDGRWSTSILMPAEITGNYTPARLTLYAYDEGKGVEANGSTENLYVYGYDDSSTADSEGPSIKTFRLNSEAFADGDLVHSNSVAMATVSDPSGISISDAGLGHKMSLTLDDNLIYDDVSNFFTPDPESPGAGSIVYPLQDLQPGSHQLRLTVWDNANNSNSSTLTFKVGLNMEPQFVEYTAYYDRESDNITMRLVTDRLMCRLDTKFECFDLSGAKIWEGERSCFSGKDNNIGYTWDIRDANGHRVPRGIYILKATVTGDDGLSATENKKIAIP